MKMLKKNSIYNYSSRYNILGLGSSNFEELEQVIEKKDYCIYQKLCELVNSCRIVDATNDWFIVEIDVEENNHLVEDLNRKFFIMQINQRAEKKIGHGYILGNLFVMFNVHYFKIMEFILEFVPQKVKKLEYMATKKCFIICLIYHISLHIAFGVTVHVKNFKVAHYQMGKKIFVVFVDLN